MIIDCVSDLHGKYPELEGGDLLIIAGDCTATDYARQWVIFFDWLKKQKYSKKILVAGNHDGFLSQCASTKEALLLGVYEDEGFEYLQDSGTEFEGLKIWGTPWTPWFMGVHPSCKHFMMSEAVLDNNFMYIPDDTDILISHGPPFGVLDKNIFKKHCGSYALSEKISKDLHLKYHIFGHIHEGYGEMLEGTHVSINCSIMDENYYPTNKPVRINLN